MGRARRDPQEDLLKELVVRARDGDARSYGKIFKMCYGDIYDYVARRVGNRSDAEDLTMQVFAKGFKAVGSYEERGLSVRAWLYRIAHNAVVDHFRLQRPTADLDDVPEIPAEGDILSEISRQEELRELYLTIAGLPPAQAEVLILRFIEDRSVAETAGILDKKEVTVRALQFKGVKSLRHRLAAGEADSPGRGEAGSRNESEKR
jgi:RNA polymerase sigma-70 factor (ECF subfamily)